MGLWTQFQSIRLARSKVAELFALDHERSGRYRAPDGLQGAIELSDIHFSYPGQEKALIRGLSLKIKPGEAIGILGDNGVGKSTLIQLMSGFLQPERGKLLLDGRDIHDYDLEFLRAQIGIIPQRGILFEGSILENMTLYREGKAIDDALELAQMLGLSEILARLPEGLDTHIGGSAVDTLSEGVRQKIIMIRSLVGHPSIVLMDDANANFDIKNDNKLLNVIKRLKGDRTLVIVSHRPSFLRACDRQFELKEGVLHEVTASMQGHSRPPAAAPTTQRQVSNRV